MADQKKIKMQPVKYSSVLLRENFAFPIIELNYKFFPYFIFYRGHLILALAL